MDLITLRQPPIRLYNAIIKIGHVLGLIPCDGSITISRMWTVGSATSHCLILSLTIAVKVYYFPHIHRLVDVMMLFMRVVVDNMFIVVHIAALVLKRKCLIKMLSMSLWTGELNYNPLTSVRARLFLSLVISGVLSNGSYLIYVYYYPSVQRVANMVALEIPQMITFLIILQFTIFIDYMRNLLENLTSNLSNQMPKLLIQVDKHRRILYLFDYLNEFYSWQMVALCMRITYNLVVNMHTMFFIAAYDNVYILKWVSIIYFFSFTFRELAKLFIICGACTDVGEEVRT